MDNLDERTVAGFGEEWRRLDQSRLDQEELQRTFELYFRIFPWSALPEEPIGFDIGCGSGRWARCVAPRVTRLHCIDASPQALIVARRNLAMFDNCEFHLASVDSMPLRDGSMDFGYALGVLHHLPDTLAGIRSCVAKLKAGAPLLLYLYYALENRPGWYRALWRLTDLARLRISRFPRFARFFASEAIAALVYYPLARISHVLEGLGVRVDGFPLAAYRDRSFYSMRTDALDRFGTRLERRFSASEVRSMMEAADLEGVVISDSVPYWCALGYKSAAKNAVTP